jgi:hypothetical protein
LLGLLNWNTRLLAPLAVLASKDLLQLFLPPLLRLDDGIEKRYPNHHQEYEKRNQIFHGS